MCLFKVTKSLKTGHSCWGGSLMEADSMTSCHFMLWSLHVYVFLQQWCNTPCYWCASYCSSWTWLRWLMETGRGRGNAFVSGWDSKALQQPGPLSLLTFFLCTITDMWCHLTPRSNNFYSTTWWRLYSWSLFQQLPLGGIEIAELCNRERTQGIISRKCHSDMLMSETPYHISLINQSVATGAISSWVKMFYSHTYPEDCLYLYIKFQVSKYWT